ncbi:MAG: hypothetical protein GY786_14875 [Proteobacteria bacterium]|nr:hypothetical protein [Pseudomonadota bacterium]
MPSSIVTRVDKNYGAKRFPAHNLANIDSVGVAGGGKLTKKQIRDEIELLIEMMPFDSMFLGEKLEFGKPKRRLRRKKTKHNITRFRVEINNIAQRNGVCNCRELVNEAVDEQPWDAELRALHAILIFNDVQTGPDNPNKLKIVKEAVVELSLAIYNGANSVFNTAWFVKIYFAYLSGLNARIKRLAYKRRIGRDKKSVKEFREFDAMEKQFLTLLKIKDLTKPHQKLRTVVGGTSYLTSSITIDEYKQASAALLSGEIKRKIGTKRADFIMYIYNTTMLLFSKIPILEKLVTHFAEQIPTVHRDLILQKQMIIQNIMSAQFQIAKNGDDMSIARDLSTNIFDDCNRTIHEYLETAHLTKMNETDPFLRVGWVVKESQNIGFANYQLQKQALQAQEYIEVIMSPRCDSVTAHMRAREYSYHLKGILSHS